MITNTRITPAAEAAAQRYGLLVEGWRSLFQMALSKADGPGRAIAEVKEQAYAMAWAYIDAEREEIRDQFAAVAYEAHQSAHDQIGSETPEALSDALTDLLSESEEYLATELIIQTERDIAFLVKSLRQTALQIQISARSQGIAPKAALIQHRIGNAAELHFFFHDRGGQKWPSRKFVRGVWRHSLLSIYNETVLLTLADHGFREAQVYHASKKADVHGMILAMHSGSEHPTYAEVRNEIFHPNADAVLGAVEEDSDVSAE